MTSIDVFRRHEIHELNLKLSSTHKSIERSKVQLRRKKDYNLEKEREHMEILKESLKSLEQKLKDVKAGKYDDEMMAGIAKQTEKTQKVNQDHVSKIKAFDPKKKINAQRKINREAYLRYGGREYTNDRDFDRFCRMGNEFFETSDDPAVIFMRNSIDRLPENYSFDSRQCMYFGGQPSIDAKPYNKQRRLKTNITYGNVKYALRKISKNLRDKIARLPANKGLIFNGIFFFGKLKDDGKYTISMSEKIGRDFYNHVWKRTKNTKTGEWIQTSYTKSIQITNRRGRRSQKQLLSIKFK